MCFLQKRSAPTDRCRSAPSRGSSVSGAPCLHCVWDMHPRKTITPKHTVRGADATPRALPQSGSPSVMTERAARQGTHSGLDASQRDDQAGLEPGGHDCADRWLGSHRRSMRGPFSGAGGRAVTGGGTGAVVDGGRPGCHRWWKMGGCRGQGFGCRKRCSRSSRPPASIRTRGTHSFLAEVSPALSAAAPGTGSQSGIGNVTKPSLPTRRNTPELMPSRYIRR
jgi:hypothetical protein